MYRIAISSHKTHDYVCRANACSHSTNDHILHFNSVNACGQLSIQTFYMKQILFNLTVIKHDCIDLCMSCGSWNKSTTRGVAPTRLKCLHFTSRDAAILLIVALVQQHGNQVRPGTNRGVRGWGSEHILSPYHLSFLDFPTSIITNELGWYNTYTSSSTNLWVLQLWRVCWCYNDVTRHWTVTLEWACHLLVTVIVETVSPLS